MRDVVVQRRVHVDVAKMTGRRRSPPRRRTRSPPSRRQSSAATSRRRLARPDAVGEADRRQRPQEVAHVERHVVRLDDAAAGRVEHVGRPASASGTARGRPSCRRAARRRPARTAARWSPRTPCGRRRRRGLVRVAGVQARSSEGAFADLRPQEPGSKCTTLVVDRLPGGAEQLDRAGVVEPDSRPRSPAARQPSSSELEVIVAEHVQARHRVSEHRSRRRGVHRVNSTRAMRRSCTGASRPIPLRRRQRRRRQLIVLRRSPEPMASPRFAHLPHLSGRARAGRQRLRHVLVVPERPRRRLHDDGRLRPCAGGRDQRDLAGSDACRGPAQRRARCAATHGRCQRRVEPTRPRPASQATARTVTASVAVCREDELFWLDATVIGAAAQGRPGPSPAPAADRASTLEAVRPPSSPASREGGARAARVRLPCIRLANAAVALPQSRPRPRPPRQSLPTPPQRPPPAAGGTDAPSDQLA